MMFMVKLRNLKPGEVSVRKEISFPGAEWAFWECIKPHLILPPGAWGVVFDLRVTVDCVVPKELPKEFVDDPQRGLLPE